MRTLKNIALIRLKQARFLLKHRQPVTRFLHEGVPYFSQWESPSLVQPIIEGTVAAESDPLWKNSGAISGEEYKAWSWSGCGMACTKMVLAHLTGKTHPLVELGKKCADYGGYTLPIEESAGLIYAPFTTFLAQEHGITADVVRPLLIEEIIDALANGDFVIASVSPKLRTPSEIPPVRGGHLVLMLGYDLEKELLYFHNPSGFEKMTQSYASLTFTEFKKFFGNRGIVIHTKQ